MSKSTPMHIAASTGNVSAIRRLLADGQQQMLFIPNEKGELPLHLAAIELDVLQLIVPYYDNINIVTNNGDNVLHYTIIPRIPVFWKAPTEFLLKNGAKIMPNKQGKTPALIAQEQGNIEANVNFTSRLAIQHNQLLTQ